MQKKVIKDIYYKPITFENVYDTWNIVRRTCKNRRAIFRFSVNKNTNVFNIYRALVNKNYKPLPFVIFLIFEPKPRLVMSQTVSDKIVNHFIANHYLLPFLERKLIDSNVATRKSKGSRYAGELLQKFINTIRIKEKDKEIYCLNIDISKYFYNIDHNILIKKLEREIEDKDVINLIKVILDETNKPYVNEIIDKVNARFDINIPRYKKDVGLSIGAMTSQFFAIYYLNDLDHYIKENLKCKYYVRYMDDFIILDTDRDKLKRIWKLIEKQIELLNLKVNPKSNITSLTIGISFVGYKYKIENGKFKIKYKKKTIRKINKKLSILKKYDLFKYYKTYGSYYGYLSKIKDCERNFKMKAIEKYKYHKEKKPKNVIFIKEGNFYKTFLEDAILVWHLFGYKWNNDSIAFGITPSSKVFDELRKKGIGYGVIKDNEVYVDNDGEVYDLYCKIANKNFDKYKKSEELHRMLDDILNKDINSYEIILESFKNLEGAVNDEEVCF